MGRLVFAVLALVAVAVTSHADPVKVPAFYDTVYVPAGFDSNDHIQIVGEGLFRNSCYRPAETEVNVDLNNKRILIGPAAYEYSGFCLQMILPFDRVIDVGILPEGNYEIVQAIDKTKLGVIPVRKSFTSNPDDYLYAPISQAFFRQKGAVAEIYLTGSFSNSCMTLKEVKVSVEPKVIVVQPIAEMNEGTNCQTGSYSFEKMTRVELVPAGRYLLHIRSMNSKAVNTLVDVK